MLPQADVYASARQPSADSLCHKESPRRLADERGAEEVQDLRLGCWYTQRLALRQGEGLATHPVRRARGSLPSRSLPMISGLSRRSVKQNAARPHRSTGPAFQAKVR